MATRWIHKGPVAEGTGAAHGFSANDSDVVLHHNGARSGVVSSTKIRNITAAAVTATAADSGSVFVADSTTSVVVQLPATVAGLTFTLVVKQLTAASGHAFSPATADKIFFAGLAAVDNKDLICAAATDRVGDTVTLVGDGLDGWYASAALGTFAMEV